MTYKQTERITQATLVGERCIPSACRYMYACLYVALVCLSVCKFRKFPQLANLLITYAQKWIELRNWWTHSHAHIRIE